MFGAKNAWPNHLYGSTTTIQWLEDECLCLVQLMKEYVAKTKDTEEQSEKLFVTWKKGPVVTASNATIDNWFMEILTLTNIRASEGSIRKAAASYAASQGALIRKIMEANYWTQHFMDITSDTFLESYWLRYWNRYQPAFRGWMWQP